MVEADSHLNLLSIYILVIYKVFEHIDMMSIGLRDIGLGDELSWRETMMNTTMTRTTLMSCRCAAYYRNGWAPPPPMLAYEGPYVGRRMMVEV
jgi:hypothetical protein